MLSTELEILFNMKTILYGLCLLSLCVIGATSLKCYICTDAEGEKGCGNGTGADPKFLKDCTDTSEAVMALNPNLGPGRNWSLCRKMITQDDFDVNSNKTCTRIKRTCGWDDEDEKYVNTCYYRGDLGGRTNVCSCNMDGCNGSGFMGASLALLVPAAILAVWKVLC